MNDESQNSIAALIGQIDNTPLAVSVIPTPAVSAKEGKAAQKRNIA